MDGIFSTRGETNRASMVVSLSEQQGDNPVRAISLAQASHMTEIRLSEGGFAGE
jgi:hypothetical protein